MPERYDPKPGFWKPKGGRPSRWVKDTAETLLEVQDYTPPRPRRVHFDTLPKDQQTRESAFRMGVDAHQRGLSRASSIWHQVAKKERTMEDLIGLGAFEQGWDTAERRVGSR
jgi:hypothetical protein